MQVRTVRGLKTCIARLVFARFTCRVMMTHYRQFVLFGRQQMITALVLMCFTQDVEHTP